MTLLHFARLHVRTAPQLTASHRRYAPTTCSPDANEELSALRKERGYSYFDYVNVSREGLPNYEDKLKIFYEEHLHTDEEIRFVLRPPLYWHCRHSTRLPEASSDSQ